MDDENNTPENPLACLDELGDDLAILEPIEVTDQVLVTALETVREACDDRDRRRQTGFSVAVRSIVVPVVSLAWVGVAVTALEFFSVQLFGPACALAAGTAVAVFAALTRDWKKLDLTPEGAPKPLLHRSAHEVLIKLPLEAIAGPVWLAGSYFDLMRRSVTEQPIEVTDAKGENGTEYRPTEILKDVRVDRILLQLIGHLERWRFLIVKPNKWIAAVGVDPSMEDRVDKPKIQLLREYGQAIERLMTLAGLLLRIEGPLGNEYSRDQGEEDELAEIERLIGRADDLVKQLGVDPAKQLTDSEMSHFQIEDQSARS
jgi:hypothetical protein